MAIQKIKGVESVKVSLKEGMANIRFRPGNAVSVEDVRKVAVDGGFTPKGAEVVVAGTVIDGGTPALAVTGLNVVYRLVDQPASMGKSRELHDRYAGKEVIVTGDVAEPAKNSGEPRVLQVRSFTLR